MSLKKVVLIFLIFTNFCYSQIKNPFDNYYRYQDTDSLQYLYESIKGIDSLIFNNSRSNDWTLLYHHFLNLEMRVAQAQNNRNDKKNTLEILNEISSGWLLLNKLQINNFPLYFDSNSTQESVRRLELISFFVKYNELLIEVANNLEDPNILYGFSLSITNRLLSFKTSILSDPDSKAYTKSDSMYWYSLYELLKVDYGNFCFSSNIWRAKELYDENGDKKLSMIEFHENSRNGIAFSFNALANSKNTLSKYLATFFLGRHLKDEGIFPDAQNYFSESLSIVKEIETSFPNSESYLKRFENNDKQFSFYNNNHPIQLKTEYWNFLKVYVSKLEEKENYSELFNAYTILFSIWNSNYFTNNEKLPIAKRLKSICIKLIKYSDGIKSLKLNEISKIYNTLNEIETFYRE